MNPETASSPALAAVPAERDPYRLDPADVEDPPRRMVPTLKRIGPGMILAASIVGSGELIATTELGAQVGFAALWVILLSCFIKPIIQAELGRFAVATGEASLESFDRLPGPRLAGARWVIWGWAAMVLMTQFQIGAMFGGVAEVLSIVMPGVPVKVWVLLIWVLTLVLLLGGGYERIERLAMVKVGLFTLLTLLAAVLLVRRQDFDWSAALSSGFQFNLQGAALTTAIAVFGMTGVGTGELFMYPYWCVEKGYARSAGKRATSGEAAQAWVKRARGWVRVMHFDILASMVIYTVATLAFFFLGAGVLKPMGLAPSKGQMIPTLSRIYTETLGGWALPVFYVGAVVTLYGTIFAATAAHSRMLADMVRVMGRYPRDDYATRVKLRTRFTVLLATVGPVLFLIFGQPVTMVKAGGMAQSLLLPVTALGAVYLSGRQLPKELRAGPVTKVALWVGTVLIVAVMLYYFYNLF